MMEWKGGLYLCGSIRFGYLQYVALEDILAEGHWEVDILPYIIQGTIRMYRGCVVCIEEAVD